jgi:hypothetical protein
MAFDIVDADMDRGVQVGINLLGPVEEADFGQVGSLTIYPVSGGWTLLVDKTLSAGSLNIRRSLTRERAVRLAVYVRQGLPGRRLIQIYPPHINEPMVPWNPYGDCHNACFPKEL